MVSPNSDGTIIRDQGTHAGAFGGPHQRTQFRPSRSLATGDFADRQGGEDTPYHADHGPSSATKQWVGRVSGSPV